MRSYHYLKIVLLASPILFALFSGCKKGEDDPKFTLLSRKQRAIGEWELKQGKVTVKIVDSLNTYFEQAVTYNKSNYELVVGGTGVFTGPHQLQITLSENGSFAYFEKFDSDEVRGKGTWDFLAKSHTHKNKERILLNLGSTGVNSFFEYAFNKTLNAFQYQLKELSKDQLVMTTQEEVIYVNLKGKRIQVTAEYSFQH